MEFRKNSDIWTLLARISHTFPEQIAALPIEIASQVGEDSVHATRPRPLERQDHRAECASCQRKCEKCGLDRVLPCMRGIAVEKQNLSAHLMIYIDGEASDDDLKICDDIFKGIENLNPKLALSMDVNRLDFPSPLPHHDLNWIYLRREQAL
jgi:hypothetical protein